MRHAVAAVVVLTAVAASACAGGRSGAPAPPPQPSTTSTTAATSSTSPAATSTTSPAATPEVHDVVEVVYRVERRATDEATMTFVAEVERVLADPRGWSRAGFALVPAGDAPFLVVLAEPDEAQELCRPYDVYRTYSCQNGPVVVINAERWRHATPQWTGDLDTYREMVINHEVGHLLGMRHPEVQCPNPGEPAPVMAQQSTELHGCRPNAWPLDHEIERAARHDLPLAPPYDR